MGAKYFYSLVFLFIFLFFNSCTKSDVLIYPIKNNNKTILVIGSSTAEGIGATPRDSSWVNKLKLKLSFDDKKTDIINLAVAGYTTFDVLPSNYPTSDIERNIDKALSHNPDLVIINLPSNDMAKNYTDNEILANYEIITDKINEARKLFIIFSTQPRNFTTIEKRKSLALFNEKLENNYPGKVLHNYNRLATSNYLIKPDYSYGDGVHLNNAGHHVIYQAILNDNLFKSIFY